MSRRTHRSNARTSSHQEATWPSRSFLFSVDELTINDDPDDGGTVPLTNIHGNWEPPVYRNGFRSQITGSLYRWQEGTISAANEYRWSNGAFRTSNNARLSSYRDSTLFFCNGRVQFMTVPGNAREYDIATEAPYHWLPLTFSCDEEVSRVAEGSAGEYIYANGREWINALGLAPYAHPYRHEPPFGALSGNLATVIGLVAFSCQAAELGDVLLRDQAWLGYQWRGHNRRDGRDDQRGVVVNIYLDPANRQGSTKDTLYALEWTGPALIY